MGVTGKGTMRSNSSQVILSVFTRSPKVLGASKLFKREDILLPGVISFAPEKRDEEFRFYSGSYDLLIKNIFVRCKKTEIILTYMFRKYR